MAKANAVASKNIKISIAMNIATASNILTLNLFRRRAPSDTGGRALLLRFKKGMNYFRSIQHPGPHHPTPPQFRIREKAQSQRLRLLV
jgi:hypothetical protein